MYIAVMHGPYAWEDPYSIQRVHMHKTALNISAMLGIFNASGWDIPSVDWNQNLCTLGLAFTTMQFECFNL